MNHHERTQILGEVLNQPVLEPGEDLCVCLDVRVDINPSKFYRVLVSDQGLAESTVQLVQKGDHVLVFGSLSLGTFNRRPALIIKADEVIFLGRRQITPVRQPLIQRS
jgi:hypothetical protein